MFLLACQDAPICIIDKFDSIESFLMDPLGLLCGEKLAIPKSFNLDSGINHKENLIKILMVKNDTDAN
jgi:hypothetical protein